MEYRFFLVISEGFVADEIGVVALDYRTSKSYLLYKSMAFKQRGQAQIFCSIRPERKRGITVPRPSSSLHARR